MQTKPPTSKVKNKKASKTQTKKTKKQEDNDTKLNKEKIGKSWNQTKKHIHQQAKYKDIIKKNNTQQTKTFCIS